MQVERGPSSDIAQGLQTLEKISVRVIVNCPLCGLHLDNQAMAFNNCPVLKANITIKGKYEDLFKKNVSIELVKTLVNISKFREET